MPYNQAAIAPSEEISGTTTLPLARVKKILAADDEINSVSANASFAITIATEEFIRYLAVQSYNVVKSEKKNRRNIQYKDVAEAVARVDNLQFLEDLIPKTTTYGEYKAKKTAKAKQVGALPNGQTTLDSQRSRPQHAVDAHNAHVGYIQGVNASGGVIHNQPGPQAPSQASPSNGQQIIFEHYEPRASARRDESGDIEMS